jgi:hypothetical protein
MITNQMNLLLNDLFNNDFFTILLLHGALVGRIEKNKLELVRFCPYFTELAM